MADQNKPKQSPELAAIGACVAALEGLPEDVQARAVRYLAARFGNFVAPVGRAAGQLRRPLLDDDAAKPQSIFG